MCNLDCFNCKLPQKKCTGGGRATTSVYINKEDKPLAAPTQKLTFGAVKVCSGCGHRGARPRRIRN